MDSFMDLGTTASDKQSGVGALPENYSWQIPISHDDFQILKNYESQLCGVLQNKFGCISILDSRALQTHSKSLPVFRKMLNSVIEVSVWKDNLTKHVVDAVVNAANEYLSHGAGLARALVEAGGPKILEESKNFVSKFGPIPPGNIALTKAGRLPCKVIIHAVGPRWSSEDGNNCISVLRCTIQNILSHIVYENLTIESVAIPAISSGLFHFPLHLCTQIILETIRDFFHNKMPSNLREIHLVSNEDPTVAAFKTASENILGKNELESLATSAELATDHLKWLSLSSQCRDLQGTAKEKKENGPKAIYVINLMGSNEVEMKEAKEWIQKMLSLQWQHVIENNHILYFGKKEHDDLSQLQKTTHVSISEMANPGNPKLEIKGARADLIEAVMNIECMLCEVQEEMARKNEQHLWSLLTQWTNQPLQTLEKMKGNTNPTKFREVLSAQELKDKKKQLEKWGFQVIKVEKINNEVLKAVFQAKKKALDQRAPHKEPVSHRLFHQAPRQFCDAICSVGFHRMYSMPCDLKYGAGVYFTKNLKTLADQIKKNPATDKLVYVFEAEVLTGSFCQGGHLDIVPPSVSAGDIIGFDSVVDNVASPETFVIFNGTQAIPQYLWTCSQGKEQSQNSSIGQIFSSAWKTPKDSSVY